LACLDDRRKPRPNLARPEAVNMIFAEEIRYDFTGDNY
jgi:hypothetical protein